MPTVRPWNAIIFIALPCLTFLYGCAGNPTKQSGRVMTGDEIKAMLTYNSEKTTNASGGVWRSYHPNEETEVGRYTEPNGKTTDITARKFYKENAICAEWSRPEWGTQCYELRQDAGTVSYRNVNDSKDHGIMTVLEGNPFEF